ncbi:hypothetical protein FK529_14820 [Tsukamurella asaccharolytica]|uniref:RNase H type-1 domain-containing protein n=1 Tax=Tsukamurella asaccharolytica TaxID=2592067 RepID=A0A5C5R943_9ACTN|nr:RNase H family protein [Tsukamurella asaccharolytica]TWS18585.1 hypothetical protein FK529_14820 [Tsukamurella asaccharolytica]
MDSATAPPPDESVWRGFAGAKLHPVFWAGETSVEGYWFPNVVVRRDGDVEVPIVVASDGSIDPRGHWGAAAVSSRGDVTLKTGAGEFEVGTTELEAVILAVQLVEELEASAAVVLVDSDDALAIARNAQGKYPPARTRGIDARVRYRLEAALFGIDSVIEFQKVKAHSGHELNDAADHVAWLGRRATRGSRTVAERELSTRLETISEEVLSLAI